MSHRVCLRTSTGELMTVNRVEDKGKILALWVVTNLSTAADIEDDSVVLRALNITSIAEVSKVLH
jgi:hypothetical protein